MNQARVSPDGFVAQRFDVDFNGRGHWLLMHIVEGNLTATVLIDEKVKDWPPLVLATRCTAIINLGPGVRGFKVCRLTPGHDGEHSNVADPAAAQPAPSEVAPLKLSVESGTRCDQCDAPVRTIDYDGGHFRNEPCGHSGAHVAAEPTPETVSVLDGLIEELRAEAFELSRHDERVRTTVIAQWLIDQVEAARLRLGGESRG